MSKSHKQTYPNQYKHELCGIAVQQKNGRRFIVERVIETRFGLLVPEPGTDKAHGISTLTIITHPVRCPVCKSEGPITAKSEIIAYVTLGNPTDGADFENVEYDHVELHDKDTCSCDQCAHEAPYIDFKKAFRDFYTKLF